MEKGQPVIIYKGVTNKTDIKINVPPIIINFIWFPLTISWFYFSLEFQTIKNKTRKYFF